MTFAVIWKDQADQDLANLWMNAADRAAVTAAANRVEFLLERDPLAQGESRDGNDRLMFEGLLGVSFRVDVRARRVLVLSVGLSGRTS